MSQGLHLAAVLAVWSGLVGLVCGQETAAPAAPAAPPAGRFVRGTAELPATARSKRQAQIVLDEATRSLIVTTDPTTNEQIQAIVRALDQPAPQALIKVLFLEVTHGQDGDLGVDLSRDHTSSNGNGSILSSLFGVASETRGGIVTLKQNDLEATLRALAQVSKLNVLSRPSILARNNEEATITIGKEVPFIRDSRVTDTGQTINTVQYEDVGIILTVTPHIATADRIELDIAPEITALSAQTVPISDTINAPVIDKRSAETHVVVPSGKTIVIGGLMEDQETTTVRKVPVLGDIWLLGALFRRTITSKTKTELLIFLTPTVVDSSQLVDLSADEQQQNELIRQETPAPTMQRFLHEPSTQPAK